VLLWDIDGTLVCVKRKDSSSPHKNVLNNHGILSNDSEMRLSGRTDFEIFLELTKGISGYFDKSIFLPAFEDLDKESSRLDKLSTFDLLPGVVDMLNCLASRGWKHGVLTGKIASKAQQYLTEKGQSKVFILGDTPYDIIAARSAHFSVISVATGDFSVQELSRHNPDLIVRDLFLDADVVIKYLEEETLEINQS
jgi:phosphoglycolate phosphatase-like HAD superfamily hydrolase